ncbi:MAG: 16S rRNA (adenine(1518)-N(6)/adenine(1519)-N(6))-dimethyltransferase RsmA, partial [Candidatus Marinimicrobia bacterium]|nr:16S rRNA (adenine(1518)-N(6)/adenine(1519)-N(6))-dimethyltransferase RsmA [Candidatus Neomarinimicrobiota bacterium]
MLRSYQANHQSVVVLRMGLRPDIRAFKKWGQNFITDPALLDKLVRTVKPQSDDMMVEIGPGTGALTRLFVPRVKQFHAIEIDERMDEFLAPIGTEHASFSYEFMDFQKWSPPKAFGTFRVIGNIPYYITSPLILQVFKHQDVLTDVHFLMQKEVGKRLVAPHGSKQYGILSVYAALFANTEYLFDISRKVFHPVPDVDSCFVRFTFNPEDKFSPEFEAQLREVIRTAFNQRRKTLRNSLKKLLKELGCDHVSFDLG